jgi:hypothetical protein
MISWTDCQNAWRNPSINISIAGPNPLFVSWTTDIKNSATPYCHFPEPAQLAQEISD